MFEKQKMFRLRVRDKTGWLKDYQCRILPEYHKNYYEMAFEKHDAKIYLNEKDDPVLVWNHGIEKAESENYIPVLEHQFVEVREILEARKLKNGFVLDPEYIPVDPKEWEWVRERDSVNEALDLIEDNLKAVSENVNPT